MRRVLLVGAYERDNLGDLLFLLITEAYFASAQVTAAAPIAADMVSTLDRHIPAAGPLLAAESFDAIWVVGGEVGAVTPAGALRMSAPPSQWQEYVAADPSERSRILTEAYGGTVPESPYIPRPTGYPGNACAMLGLNSVGLSGIARVGDEQRLALLSTLRSARPIVVRDEASSRLLARHGIEHNLEPDLVHSLALTRPPEEASPSDYVLVQASQAYLQRAGLEEFAEALARTAFPTNTEIRLFAAGTATGHDSLDDYRAIASLVRRIAPTANIRLSTATHPWDRVDEIRRAKLWVGTSLHGRVVSTAYGVPRVSLNIAKVNRYADTWDAQMPSGVSVPDLPDAVEASLTQASRRELLDAGRALGDRADAGMRRAVSLVMDGENDPTPADRFASLEAMRAEQSATHGAEIARLRAALEAHKAATKGLRRSVRRNTAELAKLRRAIAESSPDAQRKAPRAWAHRTSGGLHEAARRLKRETPNPQES